MPLDKLFLAPDYFLTMNYRCELRSLTSCTDCSRERELPDMFDLGFFADLREPTELCVIAPSNGFDPLCAPDAYTWSSVFALSKLGD